MSKQRKKLIFHFEDDYNGVREVMEALEKSNYEVIVSANKKKIEINRQFPIDLVVIDLTIHHQSFERDGNEVENIEFNGISWHRTGFEFLKRIRRGEYEQFGFPQNVPVIIASAVGDQQIKEEIYALKVSAYLEKPFTISTIKNEVSKVFKFKNKG